MATNPSFHALRKRIQQNQKLGILLLEQLHKQALDVTSDTTTEAISATYIKLAQTQVKWCELELDILREQYKAQKADAPPASHAVPEPISMSEWELIARHSAGMVAG